MEGGPDPSRIRYDPDERPVPTKVSMGVILCRVNAATGRPEVLLVHKRYTYAFAEFVNGRYARGHAAPNTVPYLLAHMTVDELLDVWSLSFEQMWYRIWLNRNKSDVYNKRCARFQSTFMRPDGGASLRKAVEESRHCGVLLWEVPKGRRLNPREADVFCAIRELREETRIAKSEYRILPDVKRRVNYISMGTRYVSVYYVAIANPRLSVVSDYCPGDPGRPTLCDVRHMGEVSEIRWYDVEQLRLLDAKLESLVKPAFRLVKTYLKGKWASRRRYSFTKVAARLCGAAPDGPPACTDCDGWQRVTHKGAGKRVTRAARRARLPGPKG